MKFCHLHHIYRPSSCLCSAYLQCSTEWSYGLLLHTVGPLNSILVIYLQSWWNVKEVITCVGFIHLPYLTENLQYTTLSSKLKPIGKAMLQTFNPKYMGPCLYMSQVGKKGLNISHLYKRKRPSCVLKVNFLLGLSFSWLQYFRKAADLSWPRMGEPDVAFLYLGC